MRPTVVPDPDALLDAIDVLRQSAQGQDMIDVADFLQLIRDGQLSDSGAPPYSFPTWVVLLPHFPRASDAEQSAYATLLHVLTEATDGLGRGSGLSPAKVAHACQEVISRAYRQEKERVAAAQAIAGEGA